MAFPSSARPPTVPLMPAVPRIFEKKKKKEFVQAPDVVAYGVSEDDTATKELEKQLESTHLQDKPVDWASIVAEDGWQDQRLEADEGSTIIEVEVSEVGGSHAATASAAVSAGNDIVNGSYQATGTASEHNGRHNQNDVQPRTPPPATPRQPAIPLRNSPRGALTSSTFEPRAERNYHRGINSISFGSFAATSESESSSPTLPLSASSTSYTHPTPLSETRSQHSRLEPRHYDSSMASNQGFPIPPPTIPLHSQLPPGGPLPFGANLNHAGQTSMPQEPTVAGVLEGSRKSNEAALVKFVQDAYDRQAGSVVLHITAHNQADFINIDEFIVGRSHMLVQQYIAARQASSYTTNGKIQVSITSHDPYFTVGTARIALKSLYGKAPDAFDLLHMPPVQTNITIPLSMIATGKVLDIESIAELGARLTRVEMQWDSLHEALIFAISPMERFYGDVKSTTSERLEDLTNAAYWPQSMQVFTYACGLVIIDLNNPGFKLNTSAPYITQLKGCFPASRGAVQLPRQQHASLRLQIGDAMPSDERADAISSIVFSLPTDVLQHVLYHVRDAFLIRKIITERNERRQDAREMKSVSCYWEEVASTPGATPSGLTIWAQKLE